MKRIFLVLTVIVIAVLGGLWFSSSRSNSEKLEDERNMTTTAELRDIQNSLLLTGEIKPAFIVDVKPEVGGKVKKINVLPGQAVKKGDLLAVIDDTDLLTEKKSAMTDIAGAELQVKKIRGNYERATALFQQKLISKEVNDNLQSDFAIAENTLDKAKSRLQIVQDKLNKTQILAPADGTVLDVPVNEGQVVVAAASVNAGTVLMSFADLSRLMIFSQVNQIDAQQLKVGQGLDVTLFEMVDKPVKANIERIAPIAKVVNNIKGFEMRALIKENDGRLKPGMSVSMSVPIAVASQAVSIPVSAIFRENKENVVYVREAGKTEKRSVVIGINDLSHTEIKSGLNAGEQVLLVPPVGLQSKS